MQMNRKAINANRTHEGGMASHITPLNQLRRTVMTCMLWENTFYESGRDIADRIKGLCAQVEPANIALVAIEARKDMNLRHVSLLLLCELLERGTGRLVGDTIGEVISRADEIPELLAMYWSRPHTSKMPKQLKRGLGIAFNKFNEYSFAKYNRDKEVKMRDALFLARPVPATAEQQRIFDRIADGTLQTPDTWETNLSAGADKKETFVRLMNDGKLGGMAFLRNLRNMAEAKVTKTQVRAYMDEANFSRVLPFRFISAANAVPNWEDVVERGFLRCCDSKEKLGGRTAIVVDTSGSMQSQVSGKSDISCVDAGAAMAMICRELCDDVEVFAFGTTFAPVPARRAFSLRDSILKANVGYGTNIAPVINHVNRGNFDRIIVVSDMQLADRMPKPNAKHAYAMNVASYRNGVGYGDWTILDGYSDKVVDFITEYEK